MSKENKSKTRRIVLLITGAVVVICLAFAWNTYRKVFGSNVKLKGKTAFLYIPTGADFFTVVDSLSKNNYIKHLETFIWVAERMHYKENIRPGRYQLTNGMNNKNLVGLLRSGRQTPVKVTFNNIRTVEQLAGRIGGLIEADSVSLVRIFKDEELQKKNGLTPFNSISIVTPNTYEFYWNTSATQFYERMLREYNNFWNEARTDLLKQSGFNRQEVSIIASIVEQETRQDSEKPVIAGVYINRYRKGWKLEADPTLVYALGDFSIRRVLNEHKEIDSPYNTYLYTGLPPGPICIPGIASIDAVLNYSKHEYFYFCAKDDFSGYHAFAKTYNDHLLNAKKFHLALSRRGIMS